MTDEILMTSLLKNKIATHFFLAGSPRASLATSPANTTNPSHTCSMRSGLKDPRHINSCGSWACSSSKPEQTIWGQGGSNPQIGSQGPGPTPTGAPPRGCSRVVIRFQVPGTINLMTARLARPDLRYTNLLGAPSGEAGGTPCLPSPPSQPPPTPKALKSVEMAPPDHGCARDGIIVRKDDPKA